jgi:hypothetical protein
MSSVTHKQGDTFEWVVTLTDDQLPVDITSWGIRAQVRNNDTLIATLTITKTDPTNGVFTASATAAQTDTWTAGSHRCDIEFTDDNSVVLSTNTFEVNILEDISHD